MAFPRVKQFQLLKLSDDASLGDKPEVSKAVWSRWPVQSLWLQFWMEGAPEGQWWLILGQPAGSPPFAEFKQDAKGSYGKKLNELMLFLGRSLGNNKLTDLRAVFDGAGDRYILRLEAEDGSKNEDGTPKIDKWER